MAPGKPFRAERARVARLAEIESDTAISARERTAEGTPLAAGLAAPARGCAGGRAGSTSRWTGRQANRWIAA